MRSRDVREFARLGARQEISRRDAHEYFSASHLLEVIDQRARPGWTVLATDVWGLPWLIGRPISHGTWGAHDICGSVQLLKTGHIECRICPPTPDSRSNRARQGDPHLPYLVRYRGLLKFGHGDERRVHAHMRAGAEVIRVVRAKHQDVIKAEMVLRARYRDRIRPRRRGMLPTFGTGTEVIPANTRINLDQVLHGDDVTHLFSDGVQR